MKLLNLVKLQRITIVGCTAIFLYTTSTPITASNNFFQSNSHTNKKNCVQERERYLQKFQEHINSLKDDDLATTKQKKAMLQKRIKEAIQTKKGHVYHRFNPYRPLTTSESYHCKDIRVLCCFPMDVLQDGLNTLTRSDH